MLTAHRRHHKPTSPPLTSRCLGVPQASGLNVSMELSRNSSYGYDQRVEVFGSNGNMCVCRSMSWDTYSPLTTFPNNLPKQPSYCRAACLALSPVFPPAISPPVGRLLPSSFSSVEQHQPACLTQRPIIPSTHKGLTKLRGARTAGPVDVGCLATSPQFTGPLMGVKGFTLSKMMRCTFNKLNPVRCQLFAGVRWRTWPRRRW